MTISVPPIRDLVAESRKRFTQDVAEHEMSVLHNDGLYRHVRFQKPGTMTYYFDLTTWPGHLAISGDCGTFVFSRIRDMFEFFVGSLNDQRFGINPGYWSEKLQAPEPNAARRYSYEVLRERVTEWANEQVAGERHQASLERAISELLQDDRAHSDYAAHQLLYEFEHDGLRIYESWDWDLTDWDWRFLWCCWAIVWGISRYRDATAAPRRPIGEMT